MQPTPKITIVTVCYNAAAVIEETILSVINQTYSNIEYIIIDGASTDNTMEVVNKYRNRISVVVSEPDKGIFDAMNKGIKLAMGEWINFMNAGDKFAANNVVEKVFEESKKDFDVLYGDYATKYNNKIRFRDAYAFFKKKTKFKEMGFSHQSVFVRTYLAKENTFDTHFKLCADYNMIWNFYYKLNASFAHVNVLVAVMDVVGGATIKYYKRHIQEVALICGYPISLLELNIRVTIHRCECLVKKLIWD